MQSQRGEGPSLEAWHGRDKAQGAAHKHMLYQSNDSDSGNTGPHRKTTGSNISPSFQSTLD